MAAEPTARFAHLLQPIRDLSKVWNIEIAEELERYIEEVSQLLVTNPEDGFSQLNFAEAALLIQGSTAIYSRKVELLYQLVCQALDLLARKDGRKGKVVQNGLWAPIPDSDELLTIDHLIKEGRNILLDQNAPGQRGAEQRRVPLFLMPRDQADRRKTEFRISSCTVHPSGIYLLQASDSKLLDDSLASDAAEGLDAPLVPAPPAEVQDLDNRLQELLRGIDEPAEAPAAADGEAPADEAVTPSKEEKDKAALETPAKGKTPLTAMQLAGVEVKNGILSAPDPWALLDEHETVGQDLPLEVGKTVKKVNAKKLLTNADGLPDAASFEGLSDAELWSGTSQTASVAPMLAAGNPIESLFLAVAGQMKAGGRFETQRAGFSAAWLEFEDLFALAASKRRHLRSHFKKSDKPVVTPHASDDEASDCEDKAGQTPKAWATPAKEGAIGMTPLPDQMTEEDLRKEETRKEVAMLESMIEDAQAKYEATVRQHLVAMQKGDGEDGTRGHSQMYANVQRWRDQLEPLLKEFESRPEFNIHEYSQKFITKIQNFQKGDGDEAREVPFARLVHGQPRWEICRRFLTCLILTNIGNTDILFDNEDERLNGFRIKLLKAERKMISLDGEEEGQLAPAATGKRVAKKALSGAAAPGQAPKKKQKSAEAGA